MWLHATVRLCRSAEHSPAERRPLSLASPCVAFPLVLADGRTWRGRDERLVRRQLREQLRERVDARGLATAPRTERRVRVREEALALLRASGAILPQRELTRMVNEVSDEVVGFGPIEFLLKDPDVTEVMVNGPDDVYVEREGRIERAPDGLFEGEESVLHLIERIVGPLGLRVDESSPWADARLPEGSRVHATPLTCSSTLGGCEF